MSPANFLAYDNKGDMNIFHFSGKEGRQRKVLALFLVVLMTLAVGATGDRAKESQAELGDTREAEALRKSFGKELLAERLFWQEKVNKVRLTEEKFEEKVSGLEVKIGELSENLKERDGVIEKLKENLGKELSTERLDWQEKLNKVEEARQSLKTQVTRLVKLATEQEGRIRELQKELEVVKQEGGEKKNLLEEERIKLEKGLDERLKNLEEKFQAELKKAREENEIKLAQIREKVHQKGVSEIGEKDKQPAKSVVATAQAEEDKGAILLTEVESRTDNESAKKKLEEDRPLFSRRDPFLPHMEPVREGSELIPIGRGESGLYLTAIIWSPESPVAVINETIIEEGDMVGDKKVKEIKEDRVILTDGESGYELKLEEGE